MPFVGHLAIFNHNKRDWVIFKGQLAKFIKINYIRETKRSILVTHLSDETYGLLTHLVYPRDVDQCSYDELLSALDKHFKRKCDFEDKAKFFSATKHPDEKVAAWAKRLEELGNQCDFGTALEANLRDRFIVGMESGIERDKLFEHQPTTLSFKRAVEIAVQAENGTLFTPPVAVVPTPPVRINMPRRNLRVGSNFASTSGTQRHDGLRQFCVVCGRHNHNQTVCRYRNYNCHKCGKKGHLKKMCNAFSRINSVLRNMNIAGSSDEAAGAGWG